MSSISTDTTILQNKVHSVLSITTGCKCNCFLCEENLNSYYRRKLGHWALRSLDTYIWVAIMLEQYHFLYITSMYIMRILHISHTFFHLVILTKYWSLLEGGGGSLLIGTLDDVCGWVCNETPYIQEKKRLTYYWFAIKYTYVFILNFDVINPHANDINIEVIKSFYVYNPLLLPLREF